VGARCSDGWRVDEHGLKRCAIRRTRDLRRVNMNKLTAIVSVLVASVVGAHAAGDVWLTDFAKAKAQAAERKVPILADFSGSDWCGWCKKLDREVFSQEDFLKFASANYVLFIADFPSQKKLPKDVADQNKMLAEQFHVEGFPTVLVLNAEGKELARTGYQPGGTAKYIEHLKSLVKPAAKVK
jgi:thioredoxin-related protein